MALSSLFVLMTRHGLEYPNFYEKLYAPLLPSTFMAKHRAKFFQVMPIVNLNHSILWNAVSCLGERLFEVIAYKLKSKVTIMENCNTLC